jgi:hypothetical protein
VANGRLWLDKELISIKPKAFDALARFSFAKFFSLLN